MRHQLALFLCLSALTIITRLVEAKATASKDDAPVVPAAAAADAPTESEDAVSGVETEREPQHDSPIPNSESESKHALDTERNVDGSGRTKRSCGGGGGCGGGCGCGCCQSCCCCQKSCCTTCTTTTTCCKTSCCQSCCQSCCSGCCGGGGCGGGGCGGGGGGGGGCGAGGGGGGAGRKKRDIMELLGGRLLRDKRSPKNSRRRVADGVPLKKSSKDCCC